MHRSTASGGHPSLEGRCLWRNRNCKQTTRPNSGNRQNHTWEAQKNTPEPMIRNMHCRRTVAWRTNGTWTTEPSCATQSWCCPVCRTLTLPMPVGAEQNPLKTEIIYHVIDLDAARPKWKNGDVRSLAKTSAVTAGCITLGVVVGSRQFITDQLLGKADIVHAVHERAQLCQDPQTEFALLRESLGVSRMNHILRTHGHTILEEQRAAVVHGEIGQPSLARLFFFFWRQ